MYSEFVQRFFSPQTTGNWFKDLNPLSKLNILLVLAFTSLVVQNIAFGVGLCLFYYLLAILIGELRYFNGIFAKLLLTIGVFIILIRQLTVKGTTVLFSIFGWKWTLEGLLNGLQVGSVILGFSGAIILFYASTEMRDLMYALEQKGISHTSSYVILASFQTITDLRASVQTIFESQKARGIEVEGSILTRAKAFFPVISPLLLGAMASAEEKSIAMDARAFSLETQHTFLRELRTVPAWEKALVLALDFCFLALCIVKLTKMLGLW